MPSTLSTPSNFVWVYVILLFIFILLLRVFYRLRGIDFLLSSGFDSKMNDLIARFNSSALENIELLDSKIQSVEELSSRMKEQIHLIQNLGKNLDEEIRQGQVRVNLLSKELESLCGEKEVDLKLKELKEVLSQIQISSLSEKSLLSSKEEGMDTPARKEESHETLEVQTILDRLNEGEEPSFIAKELSVSKSYVELIQKIRK